MNYKLINYNLGLTTIFVVLLVIGYLSLVAFAQAPAQVILTWQANNFYPAGFSGKALATPNTPITVSAEVLRNGRLVDLEEASFIWYVDEKLASRGDGLKEITFTVNKSSGDSHFVRVYIESGTQVFENSTRIPVSSPRVVLKAPHPNQIIRTGSKPEVTAVPYFFNVSNFQNLNFFWQIDTGKIRESGNDNRLILNIGEARPGQTIQITGTARNINNILEAATSRVRLIIY